MNDEAFVERVSMALAEVGYGPVWWAMLDGVSGLVHAGDIPLEVMWQALNICGRDGLRCRACYCAEQGKDHRCLSPGAGLLDCGRTDRGEPSERRMFVP